MADKKTVRLTPIDAVLIAEGVEPASREVQLAAWQYLVDTGLAWELQGFFGRTATDLLRAGVIRPAGGE